jgi:hypothetical protein
MALLLDVIYVELKRKNPTLQKTSRLKIMNSLEGSRRPYKNPIFAALSEELSNMPEPVRHQTWTGKRS